MPAVTPDSMLVTVFGDYHVYMAKFAATVDTGDTWASGLTGIAFWLAGQADANTTQASAGVGATLSGSTFTLTMGEDNTAVNLMVIAK